MDIFYIHHIDQRPHITNLYYNQPFQTCPLRTNEQTSESPPTATSNDANKQLEPVVLYTHLSKDHRSDIQYVMKTTLSHLSFLITNPTFITLQSDPFVIHLTAPCHKKRTNSKAHRRKFFRIKGLQVLQLSKAYFYFRPSLQFRHIFTERLIQFRTHISLRLTETAMCQQLRIRKGTYLGSLQPVLLSKNLKTTDTIHRQHSWNKNITQPSWTSTICKNITFSHHQFLIHTIPLCRTLLHTTNLFFNTLHTNNKRVNKTTTPLNQQDFIQFFPNHNIFRYVHL